MISFYKRALYIYCFFVVRHVGTSTAQHARHDTSRHVTTRTTRRGCRVMTCRDVTWRNKWNLGFTDHSKYATRE